MKTPQTVLKKLEKIREDTLNRLNNLIQDQLDYKPPKSGDKEEWSLGEVFMHLAIDEIYLRELIAFPLLEGIKPPDGVTFLPPPPPYKVPKSVIQFWFDRARVQTRKILNNWPEDADLKLLHAGGLNEMNGLDWLEAYAGHESYHHKQIDRLIAALR